MGQPMDHDHEPVGSMHPFEPDDRYESFVWLAHLIRLAHLICLGHLNRLGHLIWLGHFNQLSHLILLGHLSRLAHLR